MSVTNGTAPVIPTSTVNKQDLPSHFIGGNALESAPPSAVKDFVAAHDGHSVITSVRPSGVLEKGETDVIARSLLPTTVSLP